MISDEFSDQILIVANNIICIIYDNIYNNYYIGHNTETDFKFTTALKIKESTLSTPTNIAEYLETNPNHLENRSEIKNNDLKLIIGILKTHLKDNDQLLNLINNLADCHDELKAYGYSVINAQTIDKIKNNAVEKKLKEINKKHKELEERINNKVVIADAGDRGEIIQVNKTEENLKQGLYYEKMIKKGDDYEPHYTLIGNITIQQFTLIFDKLNLFEPVANMTYTNTTTNQEITIAKQPFGVIASDIISKKLIDSNKLGVESLLTKIFVQGVNNAEFIKSETDLLKDGFFYDIKNNKVIANNVFNNLKSTKEDLEKAIDLFNKIIENRGTARPNDCILFRFMLWSPFAFCLKQLGFKEGLYSMVLWGVTDTNKTGSSVMFSNLYTDKDITLQKANTQSAIGTRLGENTFPLILDEAKDNLINPNDEEFNKNIVTDEIGRSVKDRNDNNLMQDFPALRLTVRTLNQDIEYKQEFLKRHRVLKYDNSMQVEETDKIEFNKKYKPNAPNTPLKQFQHIGKAFADRFIPYLESQSDELYDLDKLTIKILEEIHKETRNKFDINLMLPHKDRLTEQSTDQATILRNELNKLFSKTYKMPNNVYGYTKNDFINCANTGRIAWLDYQNKNELFVIKVKEFEQEISAKISDYKEIADILKILDVKYDDNNGKNIKFRGKPTKAIKIDMYNLAYKMFNVVYDVEEIEAIQEEEEADKQREEEAKEILNRKSIK